MDNIVLVGDVAFWKSVTEDGGQYDQHGVEVGQQQFHVEKQSSYKHKQFQLLLTF